MNVFWPFFCFGLFEAFHFFISECVFWFWLTSSQTIRRCMLDLSMSGFDRVNETFFAFIQACFGLGTFNLDLTSSHTVFFPIAHSHNPIGRTSLLANEKEREWREMETMKVKLNHIPKCNKYIQIYSKRRGEGPKDGNTLKLLILEIISSRSRSCLIVCFFSFFFWFHYTVSVFAW